MQPALTVMTSPTTSDATPACRGSHKSGRLVAAGIIGLACSLTACRGSDSAVTAPSSKVAVTPTSQPNPQPTVSSVAMRGTVSDGAFRYIPGARIEVLDGAQAGTTTISDSQGQFSFSGTIDDNTRFRASSEGYSPSIATLQSACGNCNPPRWVHFVLKAVTPPVDMKGDYTAMFTSACAGLPAEMRTRVYEATIGSPPDNGYGFVPLKGGTFVQGWDSLVMGVQSDYVAFWIEILVEQLAPNTYLTFNALAAAHVGSEARSTFTFPLDGTADYCVTRDTGTYNDCFGAAALKRVNCASVQLSLTRR